MFKESVLPEFREEGGEDFVARNKEIENAFKELEKIFQKKYRGDIIVRTNVYSNDRDTKYCFCIDHKKGGGRHPMELFEVVIDTYESKIRVKLTTLNSNIVHFNNGPITEMIERALMHEESVFKIRRKLFLGNITD